MSRARIRGGANPRAKEERGSQIGAVDQGPPIARRRGRRTGDGVPIKSIGTLPRFSRSEHATPPSTSVLYVYHRIALSSSPPGDRTSSSWFAPSTPCRRAGCCARESTVFGRSRGLRGPRHEHCVGRAHSWVWDGRPWRYNTAARADSNQSQEVSGS